MAERDSEMEHGVTDDTSSDTPPTTLHDVIHAGSTSRDQEKRYAPLGDRFRLT